MSQKVISFIDKTDALKMLRQNPMPGSTRD